MVGFLQGMAEQYTKMQDEAREQRAERVRARMNFLNEYASEQREREMASQSALSQARIIARDVARGDARAEQVFYERLMSGEDISDVRKWAEDYEFEWGTPETSAAAVDQEMTTALAADPRTVEETDAVGEAGMPGDDQTAVAFGQAPAAATAPPAASEAPRPSVGETVRGIFNPQPDFASEDAEARRTYAEITGREAPTGPAPSPFADRPSPQYNVRPRQSGAGETDWNTAAGARAAYMQSQMSEDPAIRAEGQRRWDLILQAQKDETVATANEGGVIPGLSAAEAPLLGVYANEAERYNREYNQAIGMTADLIDTTYEFRQLAAQNPEVLTIAGSGAAFLTDLTVQLDALRGVVSSVAGENGQLPEELPAEAILQALESTGSLSQLSDAQRRFVLMKFDLAYRLANARGQSGQGLSDRDLRMALESIGNSPDFATFDNRLRDILRGQVRMAEQALTTYQSSPAVTLFMRADNFRDLYAPTPLSERVRSTEAWAWATSEQETTPAQGTGTTPPAVPAETPPRPNPDQPPVEGARLAPDGNWYVEDPDRPGGWLIVEVD